MPLIIDEWHQCSQDFEFHIASSGGKWAAGKKRNGGISESPEEYEEESKCSKLPSFTVHPFVTRYKTKPQVQHTPPTSTSLWTKYIKKPGTGAKGGAYCTAEISCACCSNGTVNQPNRLLCIWKNLTTAVQNVLTYESPCRHVTNLHHTKSARSWDSCAHFDIQVPSRTLLFYDGCSYKFANLFAPLTSSSRTYVSANLCSEKNPCSWHLAFGCDNESTFPAPLCPTPQHPKR